MTREQMLDQLRQASLEERVKQRSAADDAAKKTAEKARQDLFRPIREALAALLDTHVERWPWYYDCQSRARTPKRQALRQCRFLF